MDLEDSKGFDPQEDIIQYLESNEIVMSIHRILEKEPIIQTKNKQYGLVFYGFPCKEISRSIDTITSNYCQDITLS